MNPFPAKFHGLALLASVVVLCWAAPAAAQPEADSPIACPDRNLGPSLPPTPDRSGEPITVFARYLDASNSRQSEARENVELFRADQHLTTEQIFYNNETKVVTVPGVVSYQDQQVWINGQQAYYDFRQESGQFSEITYGLTGSSANGAADKITLDGGNRSYLHQLSYTTCPGTNPDWRLDARELEIRHEDGVGIARGAKLTFKGVPILYTPWFSFPIDDRRQSGFLYPSFSNTNDNGFEFGVPWYWNIAPNQDATLEPRYFTNRGFMLSGQYRFLTRRSGGNLEFDYLPDDDKTGDARFHYRLEHSSSPLQRWRTNLVIDRVSDDQYFQDFGSSLYQTSLQYLHSSATLSGVGRYWNLEVLADDFQVIDESVEPENEPYRRVPRVAFWMDQPLGRSGLAFNINSELVYFDRDVGSTGARFDLTPTLYWQRYEHWGFIKPSIGYRYTSYALDRMDEEGSDTPDRGTTIASLDGGLYFDRLNADGSTQTLEPRIFYLYVPYEDQSDLPRFDTSEYTFGFSQLFNTNRFTGADRQGDANQVSVALSTRNYRSSSGEVVWSLNVGQIFYLDPLRVQLNEAERNRKVDYSPFIAEFNWHPFTRFSARTGVQWDWEQDQLDVVSFGVSYSGKNRQRASFDYRFRRDRVDQFDLRLFWPVNDQWRFLSRLNYSFADDDVLEIQAGIEYESCCWAVRTVLRRYLKNRDGDYRDGIFIELNLKGLSSLGTRAQDLFSY